jgi:hypothetical protein
MAVEALPASNGVLCIKVLAARTAEFLSILEQVTVGDGDTALISAVRLNNGACCDLLLRLRANPNACSANGSSAIACALFLNEHRSTAHLLAAGADLQTPLPLTLRPHVTRRGAVTTPAEYVEHHATLSDQQSVQQCLRLVRECVARNKAAPLSVIEDAKKVANAHYQQGNHQQAVKTTSKPSRSGTLLA